MEQDSSVSWGYLSILLVTSQQKWGELWNWCNRCHSTHEQCMTLCIPLSSSDAL